MVTPHWPYLPERKDAYSSREEEENIEHAWNTVPEEPMSYQFYYQILDGDEWGRLPKIPDPNGRSGEMIDNDHFYWKNKSCLYSLAFSENEVSLCWEFCCTNEYCRDQSMKVAIHSYHASLIL